VVVNQAEAGKGNASPEQGLPDGFFQTKNPGPYNGPFGIFYGHLGYFMTSWLRMSSVFW
jgi:hypothetical protein